MEKIINRKFETENNLPMHTEDLIILLKELTEYPVENTWIEFKLNKGSITNE
ncbi:MAG: hypothetical protein NTV24_04780 [Candidatus Woesebacteria bacterium]|nr:hypothetical protein [Candidatus Woesebacteria bacterium]